MPLFKRHKKIKIKGYTFYIKRLTVFDFLDCERYPFCTLRIEENEKAKEAKKSEKSKQREEQEFREATKKIIEKSIIKIKKNFRTYKLNQVYLSWENKMLLLSAITYISVGSNLKDINNQFLLNIYQIAKTYSKLPSEIIKLDEFDYNFNFIVTNVGLRNDYKESLISQLKSCNIDISGDMSIESLENILKSKMRRSNG